VTEQSQPPEAEASEAPTGSWETVAPGDAPAPEPAAIEAPAPIESPAPVEPVEPAAVATEIVDPPAPAISLPPPAPAATPTSSDRPEIVIGGAFAGGLIAALILKRLAR
jgi:translation initiation factor IF-2